MKRILQIKSHLFAYVFYVTSDEKRHSDAEEKAFDGKKYDWAAKIKKNEQFE